MMTVDEVFGPKPDYRSAETLDVRVTAENAELAEIPGILPSALSASLRLEDFFSGAF
jgi:hypothetical protein